MGFAASGASRRNEGKVTIGVYLYGSVSGGEGPFTVKYQTSDGTAEAGKDYVAASGTLTFDVDVHAVTFDVLLKGDIVADDEETFTVTLSDPVNTAGAPVLLLGDCTTVTVTLADAAPVLTVSPANTLICAGGLATAPHQTVVTATLTDGMNPLPGKTISFSTNRGSLSADSAVTNANGDASVTLTSNGTCSNYEILEFYHAKVTAAVGDVSEHCHVGFEPTVVEWTAPADAIITESVDLEVTVKYDNKGIASHGLAWRISKIWDKDGNEVYSGSGSPPSGYGAIQSGAATQTDPNGNPWVFQGKNNKTGTLLEATDNPIVPLYSPPNGAMKVEAYNYYQMYLMFKPAGANSQYVPLKKVDWSWEACAEWDPAINSFFSYAIVEPDPSPAVVDCDVHPVWSEAYDGNAIIKVK